MHSIASPLVCNWSSLCLNFYVVMEALDKNIPLNYAHLCLVGLSIVIIIESTCSLYRIISHLWAFFPEFFLHCSFYDSHCPALWGIDLSEQPMLNYARCCAISCGLCPLRKKKYVIHPFSMLYVSNDVCVSRSRSAHEGNWAEVGGDVMCCT